MMRTENELVARNESWKRFADGELGARHTPKRDGLGAATAGLLRLRRFCGIRASATHLVGSMAESQRHGVARRAHNGIATLRPLANLCFYYSDS
jgi:hypothetical protein